MQFINRRGWGSTIAPAFGHSDPVHCSGRRYRL